MKKTYRRLAVTLLFATFAITALQTAPHRLMHLASTLLATAKAHGPTHTSFF